MIINLIDSEQSPPPTPLNIMIRFPRVLGASCHTSNLYGDLTYEITRQAQMSI